MQCYAIRTHYHRRHNKTKHATNARRIVRRIRAVRLAGRDSSDYSLLEVRPGLGGRCLCQTLGVSASGGFGSGAQKKKFVHQYSGSLFFSRCGRRVPCHCDDAGGGVHFKGLPFLIKSIYKYTHTLTHTHTHACDDTHTHMHM